MTDSIIDSPGVRIAIVGFSLSAVVASLALGQGEPLAAGVLVMGGADLHDTFASCRGRVQRVREQLSERFGWTSHAGPELGAMTGICAREVEDRYDEDLHLRGGGRSRLPWKRALKEPAARRS